MTSSDWTIVHDKLRHVRRDCPVKYAFELTFVCVDIAY